MTTEKAWRMKKCKACKFWGVRSWHDKGWGICNNMISQDGKPVVSGSLAVAYDYESYTAATHTFEDFGCVMYEKKE